MGEPRLRNLLATPYAKGAYSIVDIGFASGAAMLLTIIAGRMLTATQFGALSVGITVVSALQSIIQGGFIDVLLQSTRARCRTGYWRVERWAPIPILLGLAAVLLTLVSDSATWPALLIAVPAVAYYIIRQGWVRAFLFMNGSVGNSLAVSASVAVLAGGWVAYSFADAQRGVKSVLLAYVTVYGIGATFAYFVGRRAVLRERSTKDVSAPLWNWGYALESSALAVGVQLASLVVVPALGLRFSAGFRGAMLAMGPVPLLLAGVRMVFLPHLAKESPRWRALRQPLVIVVAAIGAWWVLAEFALSRWGSLLLGASAASSKELLPWVGASLVTQGGYLIFFLGGRAWAFDRSVRHARGVQLAGSVIGALISVATRSVAPFFLGSIVANIVGCVIITAGIVGFKRTPQPLPESIPQTSRAEGGSD